MQRFRNLASKSFFKVILAFVALTFILFGVSDFILGGSSSWVAKVGGNTISIGALNRAMQMDRELVLANRNDDEALKYIESDQFRSDVVMRMVRKIMIDNLHKDFGINADKKIILEAVATDSNFRDKNGKFNHDAFKKFLAKNGLNEERYIGEVSNEITATMVLHTMSMVAPINYASVVEFESVRQQTRVADLLTITQKDMHVPAPSEKEVEEFFAKNQKNYMQPELRKVSYLTFSKKDFSKDFIVTDSELQAYYEKNKTQFLTKEVRNFYHVVFDDAKKAEEFYKKLSESGKATKASFAKLAKDALNKNQQEITVANITKNDLLPELSDAAFKLQLDEYSSVLTSPLGSHIFFTTEIKSSKQLTFAEVKSQIAKEIMTNREEQVLTAKFTAMADDLLVAKSLTDFAKKYNLKPTIATVKIDSNGKDESGNLLAQIKGMDNLVSNAFALKKDQLSRVLTSGHDASNFYVIKLDEVEPAQEMKFSAVKSRVIADITNQKQHEELQAQIQKMEKDLAEGGNNVGQVAAKYHAKLDKNRSFQLANIKVSVDVAPRFLNELFSLQLNQATKAVLVKNPGVNNVAEEKYVIGILREVKKSAITPEQIETAKKIASERFRMEIIQEYNSFLLKRNPVKVNDKVLTAAQS